MILPAAALQTDAAWPVVVIGGGACGLVAALATRDEGADVVVLERDQSPHGSTGLSTGFVPACGTRYQRALGVQDDIAAMAGDISTKAGGAVDHAVVRALCAESGPTIEWLADAHDLPIVLLDTVRYPGHSVPRLHAHAEKTGTALMAGLLRAVSAAGIDVATRAHVTGLYVDDSGRVAGVQVTRPDGNAEALGCDALVLACSGFGGNRALVSEHIPEMADAPYFGHTGNQGDALIWGVALGAATDSLGAYQGHGSVADPHGILITWSLMMEGGIQINATGRRFSNEHHGYSEQAAAVMAQPGGHAWTVLDTRLHECGLAFADYREASEASAIRIAESPEALANLLGADPAIVRTTLADCRAFAAGEKADPLGRDFTEAPPLEPPYRAVRVSGALFHTQGGLRVNVDARVLSADGPPLPNLLAGGGAAAGVSGTTAAGYLSGNGLLSAIALGRIAGRTAARMVRGR